MLALTLLACASPPPTAPVFVRGGVVVSGAGAEGRPVGGGRSWIERPWEPGESVTVGGGTATAPLQAECVPLFQVPLGDVSRHVAVGGSAPDTALAFDPAGDRLAVGSWTGSLVVVDAWTGAELARRRLAETMIKEVAWSPDGQTLWAAEQSVDARLLALDPATLDIRAELRLADEVQTSAPPAADDLYGVYTLPAAYALHVLPGGDVLALASHGWNDGDGVRRNAARLVRVRDEGGALRIAGGWPSSAADAVMLSMAVRGERVAVSVRRSAAGPEPADLPIDGVQVLRVGEGSPEPLRAVVFEPLAPWFSDVFIWRALALDDEGDRLLAGLGDGRVMLASLDGTGPPRALDVGAPQVTLDVPIVSSVGHLARAGSVVLAVTAATNIPFGATAPELRPPAPHPGANTLFAWSLGPDGLNPRWRWRGPHALQGLTIGPDGDTVVVGAGARTTDDRTDLFGALVFELHAMGELAAFCATEGPVFFRHAVALDGRVAVAEYPRVDDGGVHGAYRVTVFR